MNYWGICEQLVAIFCLVSSLFVTVTSRTECECVFVTEVNADACQTNITAYNKQNQSFLFMNNENTQKNITNNCSLTLSDVLCESRTSEININFEYKSFINCYFNLTKQTSLINIKPNTNNKQNKKPSNVYFNHLYLNDISAIYPDLSNNDSSQCKSLLEIKKK